MQEKQRKSGGCGIKKKKKRNWRSRTRGVSTLE